MPRVKAAGVFLIRKDNTILIGHPTGHNVNVWSIPKGKIESGEDYLEAALRECEEETNVELRPHFPCNYYELEKEVYKHKKKELYPFVIFEKDIDVEFDSFELKCNSFVDIDSKYNPGLPEMDDFKWVTIEEAREILHHTQTACLDKIKSML
jgi:8-oxo-dGTP pyrophosphatase MutT (NUDIX family)